MLEHWALIEADFTREYGIDLAQETLTWRRFINLIGALSAESVFYATIRETTKDQPLENPDDIMHDIARQLRGK